MAAKNSNLSKGQQKQLAEWEERSYKRLKEDKDAGGHGSDEMSDTNRKGQLRAMGYKDPGGFKQNHKPAHND